MLCNLVCITAKFFCFVVVFYSLLIVLCYPFYMCGTDNVVLSHPAGRDLTALPATHCCQHCLYLYIIKSLSNNNSVSLTPLAMRDSLSSLFSVAMKYLLVLSSQNVCRSAFVPSPRSRDRLFPLRMPDWSVKKFLNADENDDLTRSSPSSKVILSAS